MTELAGYEQARKSYFDTAIDAARERTDVQRTALAGLEAWFEATDEGQIIDFIRNKGSIVDEGLLLRFHPSYAVQMALVEAGRKNNVHVLIHLFSKSQHPDVREAAFTAFQNWVAMEEPSQQAYLMSELGQSYL